MKSHSLFLLFLTIVGGTKSFGCPAFLESKSIAQSLEKEGAPLPHRNKMRLFRLNEIKKSKDSSGSAWTEIPVQFDPLNEDNLLTLTNGTSPSEQPLSANDRMVMRVENFGSKANSKMHQPCRTKKIFEIKDAAKERYAYLAQCESIKAQFPPVVTHDPKKRMIDAELYRYKYLKNNQLMYEKLIATDRASNREFVGAAHANMILHLDVKRFLTLDFNNDDVNSEITGSYTGPVGTLSNISFFLNLLFFEIDLKMDTSVAFFGDSGLIPVKFEAPMEGVLNPGSGMLYHWQAADSKINHVKTSSTLPYANPKEILAGPKTLAKSGLGFCKDQCEYRMQGSIGTTPYSLDINVPRYMVEAGFYPIFIQDLGAFAKEMDWDLEEEPPADTIAIYFENSGLPKGFHQMEQWIRMGEAKESCPRSVALTRELPFGKAGLAH